MTYVVRRACSSVTMTTCRARSSVTMATYRAKVFDDGLRGEVSLNITDTLQNGDKLGRPMHFTEALMFRTFEDQIRKLPEAPVSWYLRTMRRSSVLFVKSQHIRWRPPFYTYLRHVRVDDAERRWFQLPTEVTMPNEAVHFGNTSTILQITGTDEHGTLLFTSRTTFVTLDPGTRKPRNATGALSIDEQLLPTLAPPPKHEIHLPERFHGESEAEVSRVEAADVDDFNYHAGYTVYIAAFMAAAQKHVLGISPGGEWPENCRLREFSIEYRDESLLGDAMETRVYQDEGSVSRSSRTIFGTVQRGEKLLAKCKLLYDFQRKVITSNL